MNQVLLRNTVWESALHALMLPNWLTASILDYGSLPILFVVVNLDVGVHLKEDFGVVVEVCFHNLNAPSFV
jgi:hypothetical protein